MDKVIIFDFDGTLADTFPLVVDVAYKLTGARRLPAEEIEKLRRLPLLKAVPQLGMRRRSVFTLILSTRAHMYPRMHEVPPFAGVPELVKELHEAGYRLLVLSSNRRRNVRAFLQAHQLEQYFEDEVSVLYGNVFFKAHGLRKLLRRKHVRAADCAYIGNEPLDMQAAERVGMRAIATTWSGQARSELADTRPSAIIDKPAELSGVLATWK